MVEEHICNLATFSCTFLQKQKQTNNNKKIRAASQFQLLSYHLLCLCDLSDVMTAKIVTLGIKAKDCTHAHAHTHTHTVQMNGA